VARELPPQRRAEDEMTYDPATHHRRSIRLPAYDYARAGAYFVTVVCKDRTLLLEEPLYGEIVEQVWHWLAAQYDYVVLDQYVIMPNHLHGIIFIRDSSRGGTRTAPTDAAKRKPLGRLVGAFKTVSTKRINEMRGTPGLPVWQRNYYEHVIRNEDELDHIRRYIMDNPARWAQDPENPGRKASLGAGPRACPGDSPIAPTLV
jgi:REP element-mobilizing transposase RayT